MVKYMQNQKQSFFFTYYMCEQKKNILPQTINKTGAVKFYKEIQQVTESWYSHWAIGVKWQFTVLHIGFHIDMHKFIKKCNLKGMSNCSDLVTRWSFFYICVCVCIHIHISVVTSLGGIGMVMYMTMLMYLVLAE